MVLERQTLIITINQLYDGDLFVDDTTPDDELIQIYVTSGLFHDHQGADADPRQIELK